jgi:Ca2+-binding RTX toxin-like protein
VSFSSVTGGVDYLDGGAGDDYLQGDAGDDVLLGGSENDTLYGDDPTLEGVEAGQDRLSRGRLNDLFTHNRASGNDVSRKSFERRAA